MRSAPCRSRRSERGSVLVEAAVVLPLLILLLLGAVDVGLWVFETTQAASAARSGARVGILRYRQADQAASPDAAAIRSAVSRDAGSPAGLSVQVTCVGPGDTAPLTAGCPAAGVVTPDRILVKVSWARPSLSFVTRPFGITQQVSGTAVMTIGGRPASVVP